MPNVQWTPSNDYTVEVWWKRGTPSQRLIATVSKTIPENIGPYLQYGGSFTVPAGPPGNYDITFVTRQKQDFFCGSDLARSEDYGAAESHFTLAVTEGVWTDAYTPAVTLPAELPNTGTHLATILIAMLGGVVILGVGPVLRSLPGVTRRRPEDK